jgi:hypothetical protein
MSALTTSPDRAEMLRQFSALPRRLQLSFMAAAVQVHAAGVIPGGRVLDLMCGGLAQGDHAMARRKPKPLGN